ncbi:hypothetical protein PBI_EDMUNDO_28 [Arthrobacter phage Edmundo]|nr:hypothetical protein PBI_EDMUNDO_28 [Arthrobacter phage Edmundo]
MAFTPADPTKAEVKVIQNGDQLGFDFYIPRGAKGDPGGINNGTAIAPQTDWNTITTSGMYYATGADMAGMPNSCPSMAIGVALMVIARSSSVITQHAWTVSNAHSQFQMTRSLVSAVWGPWKVYRNTTIDNTAGRAIYIWDETGNRSQLIYGDTGLRDISSLVNPAIMDPANAGRKLYVQRVGAQVQVSGQFIVSTASPFATIAATLPAGFRPNTLVDATVVQIRTTSALQRAVMSGGQGDIYFHGLSGAAFASMAVGDIFNVSFSYRTAETWPTSLPGVASGGIPNL